MNIAKNNLLIVAVSSVLLIIGILLVVFSLTKNPQNTVTITNINSCSKGIDPVILSDVSNTVYDFVRRANDYYNKETAGHYDAVIREGSCSTTSSIVKTSTGGDRELKNSVAIIDVPDAKQSWGFSYNWLNKGTPVDTVVNGAEPKCLDTEKLIYGDFKCQQVLGIDAFGTDNLDPILQYMPYYGAGFRLEYDPDTKTVSVVILPPTGTKDVQAFTENTKAIIPYWFEKRKLDQNQYRILYSSDIQEDQD